MKNSYKAGEIILVAYPFTDLSQQKVRPALVLHDQEEEDILINPISTTVNSYRDDVVLQENDNEENPLPVESCVRWKKLFTLHHSLILKKFSKVTKQTLTSIQKKISTFILQK